MPENPIALTPTETWITVPEAARLRGVKEHVFYSRLRYGRLQGRKVPTTFTRVRVGNRPAASMELWRWEVRLSDVMAIDLTTKPRRGARGVYSGSPSKRTLDELMAVIEEVRSRSQHRTELIIRSETIRRDKEQTDVARETEEKPA